MLIGLALFLSGLVFALMAARLLLKRRIFLAGINGTAGISLLSVSIIFMLILLNAHTYSRLTREIKLAEVQIGNSTSEGTPINVNYSENKQVFLINSEEWQMDGRFLKWKSWTYLLGTEPSVRLEEFSERHPLESADTPSHYHLRREGQYLSKLGAKLSDWFGIVDTYFGSSVYMPVAEGAKYSVFASISGLVARAENSEAETAVTAWMSQ